MILMIYKLCKNTTGRSLWVRVIHLNVSHNNITIVQKNEMDAQQKLHFRGENGPILKMRFWVNKFNFEFKLVDFESKLANSESKLVNFKQKLVNFEPKLTNFESKWSHFIGNFEIFHMKMSFSNFQFRK